MRVLVTLAAFTVMASCLSACAVVDAGSAVVSVASTAVSTTTDVAGDVICLVCSDDDEGRENLR